ncbi:hypothetical protein [Pantoea ananatis]|uniref:hypothetical protein n=1 Tax=Pantoea ananas TaxID=553 RepID=UPI0011A9C3D8|nr:hypothetical protein [Pantoea ananatis]UEG16539.1 hypothetical protein LLG94_13550 [Pantoea ananatis]
MKLWLPAIATLFMAFAAQAENYRVVYSPSLELEVYIDNVAGKTPDDWCQETLPIRIVSGKDQDSAILKSFLPRVGMLLANQCNELDVLPWQMMDGEGKVLATGSASKLQNWRMIVNTDAAAPAPRASAASPSRPADNTPLQHFALPNGCRFRTAWDERGLSIFVPDKGKQQCSSEGWLEGKSEITLSGGAQPQTVAVSFYQGYPLANLTLTDQRLQIVDVNKQRMILARSDAPDSWIVLPFDEQQHLWRFDGTLLIKADQATTQQDTTALASRISTLRSRWATGFTSSQKVNVLLVDALRADRVDPGAGAWRNIN